MEDVVKKVTGSNYTSLLQLSYQTPVLVIVTLTDCPHCKKGKRLVREMAQYWPGRVGYTVDGEPPDWGTRYKINLFPGYLLFWGGRVIRKEEGLLEPAELIKFVKGR